MAQATVSSFVARLDRLASSAAAAQWSAEQAIDWRPDVRLPLWITEGEARTALSQLFHGEVATGALCRRLLDTVEEPAARRCLALQVDDEARHAEVYRRYLERLGGIAPVDGNLARALESAADAPAGPLGAMVAIHVVAEGEVLRLQESMASILPCPLLQEINHRIAVDEARHVAFGRLYLGERIADLPEPARREIALWAHDLWLSSSEATLQASARRGILGRRFLRRWLERGWVRHEAALARIGLAGSSGGAP